MPNPTTNRGYVYPVENVDDWFNTWQVLMDAIDADMANALNQIGLQDITITKDNPTIRLTGTELGGEDFRIQENAGDLLLQRNDGTQAAPVWVNILKVENDGDVKLQIGGKGIILTTPDGTKCFKISVDNNGIIESTQV